MSRCIETIKVNKELHGCIYEKKIDFSSFLRITVTYRCIDWRYLWKLGSNPSFQICFMACFGKNMSLKHCFLCIFNFRQAKQTVLESFNALQSIVFELMPKMFFGEKFKLVDFFNSFTSTHFDISCFQNILEQWYMHTSWKMITQCLRKDSSPWWAKHYKNHENAWFLAFQGAKLGKYTWSRKFQGWPWPPLPLLLWKCM